jgi:sensor histidine kinase regulating citrate/malate metabolism
LRDALFADGLSTREEATDTSGRGVGLSAVKQICQQTGGRMRISSEKDRGTRFTFEWSIDVTRRPLIGSALSTSEQVAKPRYVKAV